MPYKDPEVRRAYLRARYARRRKSLGYAPRRVGDDPVKRKASYAKYYGSAKYRAMIARTRATPRAHLVSCYNNMRRLVRGTGTRADRYYKHLGLMPRAEFLAWSLADKTHRELWARYIALGRLRKYAPSIDRIDTLRGFVAGNVQWLTLSQNCRKANLWRHHAINPVTRET